MVTLADLKLPETPNRIRREVLDEVRDRTLNTCQRLGLIRPDRMSLDKYLAGRFELLATLTYPDANVDELVLCNDFDMYLFYVDDQAEEDELYGKQPDFLERYFQGHIAAYREGAQPSGEDPAAELALDIRRRMLRTMSLAWMERFADDLANYLMRGTLAGARHWTIGTVPGVTEYRRQRAWDSAVLCSQDLFEAAGAGELPSEIVNRPTFRQLRMLCTNVVAFTNDLVSYPKEVRRHSSPNNLVHVIATHERLALGAAFERVIELVNQDVAEYESLAQQFAGMSGDMGARVRRYLSGQRAWMRGNLLWSLASGRYVDPESPFQELRPENAQRWADRFSLPPAGAAP